MNKKILIPLILFCLLLAGGVAYLYMNLDKQKKVNQEMQELAALDKQEMENEYQRFADQYSEMKTQITNDSIIAQLTQEQLKTQRLLKELKEVKDNDAREIARLKKELATVEENTRVKGQYEEATKRIEGLNTEKASLSEKVAIAAQLDATNIRLLALNKKNKVSDRLSKATTLQVDFTIAKNVTASGGQKTCYVRIVSPTGSVVGNGGTFPYENKQLQCSMKKSVEYGGQETAVTTYWNITQALVPGTYQVSIFADGNMIGSRNFTFDK